MGDNKISEAAVEAAMCAYGSTFTEGMRAALEAALPHLQGEAVPVAWQVRDEVGGWKWCQADQGCYQMVKRHRPHDARSLYEHPQPAELNEVSGFVITNGSGKKYMAWGQVGPEWVDDISSALWLVRRADADALANENEDAWSILPVDRCALPPKGWACTLVNGHEGPCPTLAATGKQQVGEVHPDDVAVDDFAVEMKVKMAAARAKGRGGWEDPAQCSADDLSRMLRDHVDKGDPRDVANFCMMLHQRGEAIAPKVGAAQGSREQFEAWAKAILGDNPNWRESGEGELARQAWQAALASHQPVGDEDRAEIFRKGWEAGNAAQGIDLGPLRRLYQAYVRLLESGRDRITDLGGTCDPVDVMERMDVDLIEARNLLGIKIDGRDAGTGVSGAN